LLIIDRYIVRRYVVNFAILFIALFLFATAIDLILNLDRFVDAANQATDDDATTLTRLSAFFRLAIGFEAPRVFQFYAYLHGFIAIGAMGFTLGYMHRFKELVAIMASGVSLLRVALPMVILVVIISALQLLNQELILPRMAPLLLRDHEHITQAGANDFPVPFIKDGQGGLFQAARYDPDTQTLFAPTILERDDKGRTSRRITADRGRWDAEQRVWQLENGKVASLPVSEEATRGAIVKQQPIATYASGVTPEVITVKHFTEFASMLSMQQIRRMLASNAVADDTALRRHWYARFATIPINVLVLLIALPSFLLREPRSLVVQSITCAALTIPALVGAAIGMMIDLPGVAPAIGVFLPVAILLPIAMARLTMVRT